MADVVERKLTLTPLSQVQPRNQKWLLEDKIPIGATTIIGGGEGSGKSTYTADLAARVTRGEVKGNVFHRPRSVIIFSTEDDPEAVIRPRLEAAGADLSRVFLLRAQFDEDDDWIDLGVDYDDLMGLCSANRVSLVILDPLKSTLGERVDDQNEKQLRRALEPLNRLARQANIALIGIMHYNKRETTDPRMLLSGLRVWAAVARAVLGLIPHPENPSEILIGQVKNNYGPLAGDCERARIESTTIGDSIRTSCLKWLDNEDGNLQQHLGNKTGSSKRDEVKNWLYSLFITEDRVLAADAKDQQRERGFGDKTVRAVQKELGINPKHQEDGHHYWLWTSEGDLT